jgi:cytochrome c
MLKFIAFVFLIIVIIGFITTCGGQTPASPTSTPTGTTASQLSDVGRTVYVNHCAKCHGDNGQGITGPVLIGSSNTLDKYGTAQGLLNFIDTAMPLDAPGSLSQQEYLDIVSYLLVQNNFVTPVTLIDANHLGDISLK